MTTTKKEFQISAIPLFMAPDPSFAQTMSETADYAEFDESFTRRTREATPRGDEGQQKKRTRQTRKTKATQKKTSDKAESRSKKINQETSSASERVRVTSPSEPHSEIETDGIRRTRRRKRSAEETTEVPTEITALKGSTRLEAKKQRRREGRKERKRTLITEAEFLARRESVDRHMYIREHDGLNQIAVTEDDVLVEHYVARHTQTTMVGSVYMGKVQNVLPSMEAAFVDLGHGRNAVLYAGEVNWDVAGLQGRPRRIESALKPGDSVLVQVTKDPIGHKGARLTAQITLAGRYLVFVPSGAMTGISRKLPEKERRRLKRLLKDIIPAGHGVIVRTAAEGATEEQLRVDVERLIAQWQEIDKKAQRKTLKVPTLLRGEPELALRVVRDVFNEDFASMHIQGKQTWTKVCQYVEEFAPDLRDRLHHWTANDDIFAAHRVDEQLAKGMDRKVWLPSGGYLIIERTEAMTVIDVNTGKYTGTGGTLEETVTKNNLESAEEIVRQLRLRDIGGIIVIDFVDMVLESNRELVLRRLIECLGRDRTRHQVTEVTSLGLVQMTRKRVGQGLVEAFSTQCEHCEGRGFIVHDDPVERDNGSADKQEPSSGRKKKHMSNAEWKAQRRKEARKAETKALVETKKEVRQTLAQIAEAAQTSHEGNVDDKDGAKDSTRYDSTSGVKRSSAKKSAGQRSSSQGSHTIETEKNSAEKDDLSGARRGTSYSADQFDGIALLSSPHVKPQLNAPSSQVHDSNRSGVTRDRITVDATSPDGEREPTLRRRRVVRSGVVDPAKAMTSKEA
ncbi:MAG: Rne/Rng family ribonuclease [Actinomycetaceae bacterium]|nr:Rne/Rng family ribonuclease [Actinomycetaceae bacterium]